jgi:hypothetical protein
VNLTLNQGDFVQYTQANGLRLTLLVLENGIGVKAEGVPADLWVRRGTSFFVECVAVDPNEPEYRKRRSEALPGTKEESKPGSAS